MHKLAWVIRRNSSSDGKGMRRRSTILTRAPGTPTSRVSNLRLYTSSSIAHGSRVTGFRPTRAGGRLRSGVESQAGRRANIDFSSRSSSSSFGISQRLGTSGLEGGRAGGRAGLGCQIPLIVSSREVFWFSSHRFIRGQSVRTAGEGARAGARAGSHHSLRRELRDRASRCSRPAKRTR